jgi:hypothetical protein
MGIVPNYNQTFISTMKHFFQNAQKIKGKYLFSRYLPFMWLIFSIFRLFFDCSLGGGQTCDGHAEG